MNPLLVPLTLILIFVYCNSNLDSLIVASLSKKAAAQPYRVFLGFFYACKYVILTEFSDQNKQHIGQTPLAYP